MPSIPEQERPPARAADGDNSSPGQMAAREQHGAQGAQAAERNRLLRAMPPEEYERLRPHLEAVTIETMQIIAEPEGAIEHVHFPDSAIISALRRTSDGALVEIGTSGNEGMSGLPTFFGVDWSPWLLAGEVPGVSKRVDVATFRDVVATLPGLDALLRCYATYFLSQLAQSIACNARHSVDQRCARWLLMTHDRVGGDEFVLTHEVLSQMLAVRRAGVTEAVGALQHAGAISYGRGRMRIVDRAVLEGAACECYGVVREHLDRLLGQP